MDPLDLLILAWRKWELILSSEKVTCLSLGKSINSLNYGNMMVASFLIDWSPLILPERLSFFVTLSNMKKLSS